MMLRAGSFFPLRIRYVLPIFLGILMFSCEKPEGPGGDGSVEGQVIVNTFDRQFRVKQSESPAADEDVFISYGNSGTVDDDRTTSDDGRFVFEYLSKGDYRIFVYSEDSSGTGGTVAIERFVDLSSGSKAEDLGKIHILRTLDLDEGLASIQGKVKLVKYSNGFLLIRDTIPAQDVDVYLIYEDDPHYFERTRTLWDGKFTFQNLLKGTYRVYVYSEDIEGGSKLVPVEKEVDINTADGVFETGTIYTAKD